MDFLTRAHKFFVNDVYPWYQKLCTLLPEGARDHLTNLLLSANLLATLRLSEGQQTGAFFEIRPYVLVGSAAPKCIVDFDKQGRPREIALWVDSAVGFPDPRIRVSTDASSAEAGGIRIQPGAVNELGVVPATTKLWVSSDINITVYVIERA